MPSLKWALTLRGSSPRAARSSVSASGFLPWLSARSPRYRRTPKSSIPDTLHDQRRRVRLTGGPPLRRRDRAPSLRVLLHARPRLPRGRSVGRLSHRARDRGGAGAGAGPRALRRAAGADGRARRRAGGLRDLPPPPATEGTAG